MRTAIIALLLIMSSNLSASEDNFELHLGLKTYHFSRDASVNGCLNESHDLIGGRADKVIFGTYRNTHCRTSHYLGYTHKITRNWSFDMALVSGYPDKLKRIGKLTLIATPSYYWGSEYGGIKFLVAPTQLVGAGLVIKF